MIRTTDGQDGYAGSLDDPGPAGEAAGCGQEVPGGAGEFGAVAAGPGGGGLRARAPVQPGPGQRPALGGR